MLSARDLHSLAGARTATPADAQERVRVEIATWFVGAEREAVYRRLRAAPLAAPEHCKSDVYVAIVQRTAGALDLLDAVLADALRDWRPFAAG